jgi:hypothetical protein
MRRCRLHITGASGTGTTTLGRTVADAWSVPHADADDYFWLPTDPPYADQRAVPERVALMDQLFVPRPAWVLSGTMISWGGTVVARCEAVVFLTLAPEERLRRLEARERHQRATRSVDEEALGEFLGWARGYDDPAFDGRSRVRHEEWLAALPCPVLRLDSALPPAALRDAVLAWEPGGQGPTG